MVELNLLGTIWTIRPCLPHLLESGEADIVTLASEAGRRGLPGEAVYCASKFGQVGFTRALDHEVRERGVRATNVCPGGVATEFALAEGYGRPQEVLARDDERGRRRRRRAVRDHAPAQPPHPRDRVPADDGDGLGVIRVGLISTAAINDALLGGARESELVEVVGVASRERARAEAYARERGLERAFGSYDELLADPDVDVVYVALPNALHVEWAIRALEAGKHVLSEKPLSRRPEEVERAFDAAERAGRILMEGFMYRHHPQTKRLAQLVAEGAVGELRLVRSHFSFTLDRPARRALGPRARRGLAARPRLLLHERLAAARGRARARLRRADARAERRRRPLRGRARASPAACSATSTAPSTCRGASCSRRSAPRGASSSCSRSSRTR